jgi:hypothetical protein
MGSDLIDRTYDGLIGLPGGGAMRRLFVLSVALFCTAAFAQPYPTKPVKLIVTYPPGGSSEIGGLK